MLPPLVRRLAASLALIALALTLVGAPSAAATSIPAKSQLRGHLPELGEKPALRVFQTQATYDAYRASLGDANVFPASSSMFMSFDKDILALYIRGNDAGGRCFATATGATLDEARAAAYALAERVTLPGSHYRRDIAAALPSVTRR